MFEPFQRRDGGGEGRETGGALAARYWEEFARAHGQELVRCVAAAMRRMGWRPEPCEVDELVQEVYCRLLVGRLPMDIGEWTHGQLWAYLHRVVRNVAVDEVRSRCARKRGGPPQGEADGQHREVGPSLGEHRAPGPTPEERLLAREQARALRRRVHELGGPEHGARNLRILELAAVEGCTAAEISRRLAGALTASSIHTVLHRLRHQLAAMPGPELAAMVEV
ncbi:MAG TPA: sigma-70 family RNA polymerase sigma factor [Thermoanaerobaculia bacterium]|jgi:RNA polymerase sigma factor (sigma-70 family)|nr:sigma-70 family RNA polymerase sigma factor [Thermoanaerobaculia bacterium]